METKGELAVPALPRVQPVRAPHRAVGHPPAGVGVQVHDPIPFGQRVHHRVDRPLPPGQRAGQRPRQAEHRAGVGQAGRQQDRAPAGEGRVHPVEPGGHGVDVEGTAQGVVDAYDDGHEVRAQFQADRCLPLQYVTGLRPADREVGELHARGLLGEPVGQQGGPAAPPVARGVAHARGQRVTDGDETQGSHATPSGSGRRAAAGAS